MDCPLQSYQRLVCHKATPETITSQENGKHMQFRKLIVLAVVCAAAVTAAITPRGISATGHRASLSADLSAFEAAQSTGIVRVIAHGGNADPAAAAARHSVRVVRVLDHAAVLEANAAQIESLRGEP